MVSDPYFGVHAYPRRRRMIVDMMLLRIDLVLQNRVALTANHAGVSRNVCQHKDESPSPASRSSMYHATHLSMCKCPYINREDNLKMYIVNVS